MSDTGETISKDYIATNIDIEVSACKVRVAEARAKIRDIQLGIEYDLGIISAYAHTKFLLED